MTNKPANRQYWIPDTIWKILCDVQDQCPRMSDGWMVGEYIVEFRRVSKIMYRSRISYSKDKGFKWEDVEDNVNVLRYIRPPIPPEIKRLVWQRDDGKCAECGSRRDLEFDHDIPVSKGGATTFNNLQLLCIKCNRKKGTRIGNSTDDSAVMAVDLVFHLYVLRNCLHQVERKVARAIAKIAWKIERECRVKIHNKLVKVWCNYTDSGKFLSQKWYRRGIPRRLYYEHRGEEDGQDDNENAECTFYSCICSVTKCDLFKYYIDKFSLEELFETDEIEERGSGIAAC